MISSLVALNLIVCELYHRLGSTIFPSFLNAEANTILFGGLYRILVCRLVSIRPTPSIGGCHAERPELHNRISH